MFSLNENYLIFYAYFCYKVINIFIIVKHITDHKNVKQNNELKYKCVSRCFTINYVYI